MTNLKVIVQNRPDRIGYSRYEDEKSICLGYFETDSYSSDNNTVINDYSWSIEANYFDEEDSIQGIDSKRIATIYKDILVTNIRKRVNGITIPLFYKVKLSNKVSEYSIKEYGDLESFETGNEVAVQDGYIYTNFENKFDEKSKKYKLYEVSGTYIDGTNFNELLSTEAIFTLKTFENKESIQNFSRRYVNGLFEFDISVEKSTTLASILCSVKANESLFYWKPISSNKIKLKELRNKFSDENWTLELTNGFAIKNTGSGIYKYTLPEYSYQDFSPNAPYKRLSNKNCEIVSDKVLKLPNQALKYDSSEFTAIIEAVKYDGERTTLTIVSVDERLGFIKVEESLSNFDNGEYIIKAEFTYKCDSIFIRSLDLNPYFNKDALNKKYFICVKPNENESGLRVIESINGKVFDPLGEGSSNAIQIDGIDEEAFKIDEEAFKSNYTTIGENNVQLFLVAEVFFKDNSVLENSYFYDKRRYDYIRKEKREEFFRANPRLQNTKYGYGKDGLQLIKAKQIVADYPVGVDEEIARFTYSSKLSSSHCISYNPKLEDIKVEVNYVDDNILIEASWEGPGKYELLDSNNGVIRSINADVEPVNRVVRFTIQNTNENEKLSFYITYNNVRSESSWEIPYGY